MIYILRPLLCTWWAKWAERSPNVIKDETPFRYAQPEILTLVVVICDLTRYQLDHGGALKSEI